MNQAIRLMALILETKVSLLIVEDDDMVLDTMLSLAFDTSQFDIKVAKNFQEAEHALNSWHFDVVITDFNFPGGDGDKVAKLAHDKGVKKIYLHSGAPEQAKSNLYTAKIAKLDRKELKKVA